MAKGSLQGPLMVLVTPWNLLAGWSTALATFALSKVPGAPRLLSVPDIHTQGLGDQKLGSPRGFEGRRRVWLMVSNAGAKPQEWAVAWMMQVAASINETCSGLIAGWG